MNNTSKQQQDPADTEEAVGPETESEENVAETGQPDSTDQSMEEASREELIGKLDAANQEIQSLKDGFLRARAEVENIQRRSQNEIVSARKFAIEGFAQELLTVLDSLDQASRVELEESSSAAVGKMKEGLELTLRQMEKVMDKFGVVAVEAGPGIKFNPEIHQAISMIDGGEIESGHIISVMQKGFMLKDRLLRPAMVVTAS